MKNTNKSVKKNLSYGILLLAVLFSSTVEARVSVNNYLGAYVDAGEWSLLPKNSSYKPSLGVAGGAGFLYELRLGEMYSSTRFLLDIGVGAQYGFTSYKQSSSAIVELGTLGPAESSDLVQYDLNGDRFVYVYDIQNRHDQYQNLAVQVPLMVGFQHRKFYMLAGAKIDANLYSKAFTTAKLSTYGRYEEVDDMRNQPEYQFFENIPLKKDTSARFNTINVNVSVEIGGRIGLLAEGTGYDVPKQVVECRIAGFVDYGINDIRPKISSSLDGFSVKGVKYDTDPTSPTYVYKSTSMIDKLNVNDIMVTKGFASMVNNLVIGIKFTVLFQMPEKGKCVICQDGYQSLVRGGRGGVKYEE